MDPATRRPRGCRRAASAPACGAACSVSVNLWKTAPCSGASPTSQKRGASARRRRTPAGPLGLLVGRPQSPQTRHRSTSWAQSTQVVSARALRGCGLRVAISYVCVRVRAWRAGVWRLTAGSHTVAQAHQGQTWTDTGDRERCRRENGVAERLDRHLNPYELERERERELELERAKRSSNRVKEFEELIARTRGKALDGRPPHGAAGAISSPPRWHLRVCLSPSNPLAPA